VLRITDHWKQLSRAEAGEWQTQVFGKLAA
jgi:hypothetical protein